MVFFVGMTGGAIGPIVTGRIYDTAGTYQIAFLIMLAAGVAGLALALLLRPVTAARKA
jgi:cyanate permease